MKNSFILNFFLFIGFLVIGYTLSTKFYPSNYDHVAIASSAAKSGSSDTIQSLNNGQRSMLVIGVDSVETSKPQLQSLWLVSYLPSDPTLYFIPIYPSGNELLSELDRQIEIAFSLNRLLDVSSKEFKLVPGEKFVKFLEKSNYWWSGYFIYDQPGLSSILDLLEVENVVIDDAGKMVNQPPSSFTSTPNSDHSVQVATIQMMCQQLSEASQAPAFSEVIGKLYNYLTSNLEVQQVIRDWEQILSSGSGFNCTYPTLQGSTTIN